MAVNELFQYSVVSALMDGVASKGLPIRTLLENGDHGLGTFRRMDGEMIILDGQIYQMKSDGSISFLSPDDSDEIITPFAMVTRFSPTITTSAQLEDKPQLVELVTKLLPRTRNNYVAIRLDGMFKSVTVRTVDGQTEAREGLAELGKRQRVNKLENEDGRGIRGTVIGFRSPEFLQGVSVAGDHLHFISEDRKRGGHLTGFETEGEVEVKVAGIWRVLLEFPKDDEEFDMAKLEGDGEGIRAVEG